MYEMSKHLDDIPPELVKWMEENKWVKMLDLLESDWWEPCQSTTENRIKKHKTLNAFKHGKPWYVYCGAALLMAYDIPDPVI